MLDVRSQGWKKKEERKEEKRRKESTIIMVYLHNTNYIKQTDTHRFETSDIFSQIHIICNALVMFGKISWMCVIWSVCGVPACVM